MGGSTAFVAIFHSTGAVAEFGAQTETVGCGVVVVHDNLVWERSCDSIVPIIH